MIHALSGCLVALLSGTVPQEAGEAEKLYDRMLEKMVGAETLQVAFKGDVKVKGAVARSMEGRLLIQSPNCLYVKVEGKVQGKPDSSLTVCDGTSFKVGDKPPQPAPESAADNYRVMIAVTGLSTYLNTKAVRGVSPEAKAWKLGKKEKVGAAETQALEYTLDVGKPEIGITTTVWIDLKTDLPVKRTTVIKAGADELVCTESLGSIKAGEKIDPKMFVLPK